VLNELETAADQQASRLIVSLDSRKCDRLRSALCEVQSLLSTEDAALDPDRRSVRLREAVAGDLGWIIARHAEIYKREYGFSQEFENYVLLGLAEYVRKDPSGSKVWIADYGRVSVGSVGLVELTRKSAQLRWLLVEPHARGQGVGRKLVDQAISFSRSRKYRQVLLWTLQDLRAARKLYKAFGFKRLEERQGKMGGRRMVEECWTLTLNT
jgi:GNAT superfamily N-acetyltransferase